MSSTIGCRLAGSSTTLARVCLCVLKPSFTTSTHSNWSPTPMPSTSMAQSAWPSVPVSPHTCCLIPEKFLRNVFIYNFFSSDVQQSLCSNMLFLICLAVVCPFFRIFVSSGKDLRKCAFVFFSKLFGGWHLLCQQLSI